MGKSHRDNHAARKKRGQVAFDKKAKRRAVPKKPKCNLCGTPARPKNLVAGVCSLCLRKVTKEGGNYELSERTN